MDDWCAWRSDTVMMCGYQICTAFYHHYDMWISNLYCFLTLWWCMDGIFTFRLYTVVVCGWRLYVPPGCCSGVWMVVHCCPSEGISMHMDGKFALHFEFCGCKRFVY